MIDLHHVCSSSVRHVWARGLPQFFFFTVDVFAVQAACTTPKTTMKQYCGIAFSECLLVSLSLVCYSIRIQPSNETWSSIVSLALKCLSGFTLQRRLLFKPSHPSYKTWSSIAPLASKHLVVSLSTDVCSSSLGTVYTVSNKPWSSIVSRAPQ